MRRIGLIVTAIMLIACGGRESADDQGLHQDIQNNTSGAEVTFDATVLNDPVQSGDHERFQVKTVTGEILEVDHNTNLAPAVPVHKGDGIIVHGQLYIDPGPRYGIHCTHSQRSGGCPNPGWIEYNNMYYE